MTLPVEVLQQRLREYLARGMFKGKLTGKGFRLVYVTPWRGEVYRPWVFGRIRDLGDTRQLSVTYTLHPMAIVIMGFFLLMGLQDLFVAHSWRGVLLVVILHCGFYLLHFQPLVRQIGDIFRAMAEE